MNKKITYSIILFISTFFIFLVTPKGYSANEAKVEFSKINSNEADLKRALDGIDIPGYRLMKLEPFFQTQGVGYSLVADRSLIKTTRSSDVDRVYAVERVWEVNPDNIKDSATVWYVGLTFSRNFSSKIKDLSRGSANDKIAFIVNGKLVDIFVRNRFSRVITDNKGRIDWSYATGIDDEKKFMNYLSKYDLKANTIKELSPEDKAIQIEFLLANQEPS